MAHPAREWALIDCDAVSVPPRHRKDMGDLASLAESIRALGMLHPIGVTPGNVLLYGERRLRAVRDVLGWEKVHARVIDLADPLRAEADENEERKPFTPSERVAIAKAIKEAAGERRGRPAKEPEGKELAPFGANSLPPGRKTEDAAAEQAGFSSPQEFRRASAVVESGVPELVEAMDAGEISVSAAADAAALPVEAQKEVVAKVKGGERPRRAVEEAKAEAAPPAPTDEAGGAIPEKALAAFALVPDFRRLAKAVADCEAEAERLAALPGGAQLHMPSVRAHLKNAKDAVWMRRPYAACPYCKGEKKVCEACRASGWVTKSSYNAAPPEMRGGK